MRSIPRKLATSTLLALSAFAPGLGAAIRVDYRNPVAGDRFELLVSGAAPHATVQIVAVDDVGTVLGQIARERADGSGSLTHSLLVPAALAGGKMNFVVSEERVGAKPAQIAVRVVPPSLLVTGSAGGDAVLHHVPIAIDRENPFDLAASRAILLGPGRPGGAVRDGRNTRTFVVSDADRGVLSVIADGDDARLDVLLAPDLRDLVATPDGRSILVASGGFPGTNARLFIVPADAPTSARSVDLGFPFGPNGGRRIAVSDDGLRAFVTLDGALLREINLLALEPSNKLFAVGAPGLDEIRDLRVVGDRLVALTQKSGGATPDVIDARERSVSAVTNVDLGDPRRVSIARTSGRDATLDLAFAGGKLGLFLVDGAAGEVRVLDVETLASRGAYAVPPGADALLLTPDPGNDRGALLYGARTDASALRLFDLNTGLVAPEAVLGFAADALPVSGSSRQIDLFFVRNAANRVVAIRPDATAAVVLPLDIDIVAVSIGD